MRFGALKTSILKVAKVKLAEKMSSSTKLMILEWFLEIVKFLESFRGFSFFNIRDSFFFKYALGPYILPGSCIVPRSVCIWNLSKVMWIMSRQDSRHTGWVISNGPPTQFASYITFFLRFVENFSWQHVKLNKNKLFSLSLEYSGVKLMLSKVHFGSMAQ